jgi:hypothetical protein
MGGIVTQDPKEIFLFIDSVIKMLEDQKEHGWASKLQDSTLSSFMPGELYREIRKVLRGFQRTRHPQQFGVVAELRAIIRALDVLIGGP